MRYKSMELKRKIYDFVNEWKRENGHSPANVKKKVGQCLKKTRPPTLEKNLATWPKTA